MATCMGMLPAPEDSGGVPGSNGVPGSGGGSSGPTSSGGSSTMGGASGVVVGGSSGCSRVGLSGTRGGVSNSSSSSETTPTLTLPSGLHARGHKWSACLCTTLPSSNFTEDITAPCCSLTLPSNHIEWASPFLWILTNTPLISPLPSSSLNASG